MNNTPAIQIKYRQRVPSPAPQVIKRRFALYSAGMSQRELAKQLRISQAAVSGAISGLYTSAPVATKLAEVTGMTLSELYPDDRYSHIEQEAV